MSELPPGTLIAFYGDDHTGASAVMEVLSFAGLKTALFLDLPNEADIARFADYRAFGIAGIARSQGPDWMDAQLPGIFAAIGRLHAPISHYKVCSTFDSAPERGSIGRAIDIGAPLLGGAWHPLVVAAPALGRYQLFGNLFARADNQIYRLDRHPTMARHPATPMGEADLRLHLAAQTARRIGLIDILSLRAGRADDCLASAVAAGEDIVGFDVLDEASLAEIGRIIWAHRGERLFAIGSQGLEYALVAHWRAAGLLGDPLAAPKVEPAERIAIVSASCAPATAIQIDAAGRAGFALLPIDAARAVTASDWHDELDRAAQVGLAALRTGRSPLFFTAKGPEDAAIARTDAAIRMAGARPEDVTARIGAGLGDLLDRLMREGGVTRGVVAGGDTSGHAAQALGIHAVTALAPLAPGAPLCRIHRRRPEHYEHEIVFKGGQMGTEDFFIIARDGTGAARAELGSKRA